jgi:hypothetical protein
MNEIESDYFKENDMLVNPDEFLLDDIKMYHYEVMDEGEHVWMAFYFEDGTSGHLNIFLNNGKINTRYEKFDGP